MCWSLSVEAFFYLVFPLFGIALVVALVPVANRIPRPLISAGFLSPAFAAIIYGLALRPR